MIYTSSHKLKKRNNNKNLNDFSLKKFGIYVYEILLIYTWNIDVFIMWRGLKYLSQDVRLFFARVKSGQPGTWSLAK